MTEQKKIEELEGKIQELEEKLNEAARVIMACYSASQYPNLVDRYCYEWKQSVQEF